MKNPFKNNLIYISTAFFFIGIFFIGILTNSLPKKHDTLLTENDLNTNEFKIELETINDTITNQNDIVFNLNILDPETDNTSKFIAYSYAIEKSSAYEVIDNHQTQSCIALKKGKNNINSFKIKPLIKNGKIDLITQITFYKTEKCNQIPNNITEVITRKSIFMNITFKEQFNNVIKNIKNYFLQHFTILWGIFVAIIFTIIANFIRKKLNVKNSEIL